MTAVFRVNAIFFHIGSTIVMRTWSPGTFTATLLYMPRVGFVYWGAHRNGVLTLLYFRFNSARVCINVWACKKRDIRIKLHANSN